MGRGDSSLPKRTHLPTSGPYGVALGTVACGWDVARDGWESMRILRVAPQLKGRADVLVSGIRSRNDTASDSPTESSWALCPGPIQQQTPAKRLSGGFFIVAINPDFPARGAIGPGHKSQDGSGGWAAASTILPVVQVLTVSTQSLLKSGASFVFVSKFTRIASRAPFDIQTYRSDHRRRDCGL